MVQSSPIAGEEEEWGSEGEADRASTEGVKQASTPSASEPKSTPSTPPPPASPAPKLRLNTSLATDPALRVPVPPPSAKSEPPGSPADLEYLATLPSALQTAIVAGRLFCVPPLAPAESVPPRKPDHTENRQASGPVYVCAPCAIKFSSLSTLEAHQTYYCSHRHAQAKAVMSAGGVESEPEDVKPVMDTVQEEASGGESSTGEPATKSARSGKQYRCPHCSYSADKKVSLNRHMRMHSSSPASQGSVSTDAQNETSAHLVDRYCQDCDIRFSSLKTFKAHKMHYCSTRHVIKTKPVSAPSSPSESRTTPTSPGASDTSNHPPREPPTQPFLALPTNPILIVPYSLFQGASILSGPAVMGLPAQDTACLLLPDGTLQPLAQGLLSHSRMPPQIPSEATKRQRLTTETVVKHPEENRSKNTVCETPGAPLDLSVRTREEEGELVIDMEEEDEKENRRSVDNQTNIFPSPDPEDIICAPSIPLMLSTSSTCSSPSPAPPSPTLSSSSYSVTRKPHDAKRQRTDSQSSSPSPKSSPSGTKSPRRTPNGLANIISDKSHKTIDPKRKSSADSVSPPKMDSGNNNLTLSSLLLAAAAGQIDGYPGKSESSGIPFPPELVSHLTGARLPGGKGKPIPAIPGLIPAAGRNLPLLLPKPPRTPADLMNPATILPLLTSEVALRIAAAAGGDPAIPAPQVLVKQGVSKCQECNIVFCKHENYIAHKKHYCSARQLNEPVIVQDDDVKPASPAMSSSPPNTSSPPTSLKDQSHSPVNPASVTNPGASASKPTLLQFICAACGIKFTSYDNLTAHQAYYCPKRSSTENEKGSRRCQKCKMTVPMDHVCGSGGGAWKCPCCHVISPTASAAQKHMDTHTGVKAFLCTICTYKGNTLRGMRTHIRMHFEKRSAEIMEENYITCLLEDGSGGSVEVPAVDSEENHIRKTPEINSTRNVNGDTVKVKEEVERRPDEDEDEEYIEVEEISVVKTEPQMNSQDCKESKNAMLRRGEGMVSNVARSLQVQR